MLSARAAERSLRLAHLPIRDYEAPDGAFLESWSAMAGEISDILASGGTVALSCHYGAGRSGTMAAAMLMDRGLTGQAADGIVRGDSLNPLKARRRWNGCR